MFHVYRLFGEALFRYIDVLGRKGCSRTALEYCKLTLSLWPEEDPYGILLVIDYYTLRAREYQYFLDFVGGWFIEEFHKKKHPEPGAKPNTLLLLPNLLYSCAICKKMLNLTEIPKEAQLTEDFAKVISLKDINDMVKLSENALLIMALVMYPGLLKRIVNKIKSPSSSAWDPVLKCLKVATKGTSKYYKDYEWLCKDKNATCAKSTLKKIYSIYEEKAASCFSPENVQSWIKTVVNFLYTSFQQGDLNPEVIRESIRGMGVSPFYLDRYSHLNVLNFKDDLTTIPQEQLNPMIENTLFAQQQAAPQAPPAPGEAPNPLALFFRTLFQ